MATDLSFLWGGAPTQVPDDVSAAIGTPSDPAPSTALPLTALELSAPAPEAPAPAPEAPAPAPEAGIPMQQPSALGPSPEGLQTSAETVAPTPAPHEAPAPAGVGAATSENPLSFMWGGASTPPTDALYDGPGYLESLLPGLSEKFDLPTPASADERNTMVGNIARGSIGSVGRIIGGLVGIADQLDTWGSSNTGAFSLSEGRWVSPDELEADRAEHGGGGIARGVADWFKGWGEGVGYDPSRLTDDPLGDLSDGHIITALAWGFEVGAASIPDMAAAMTAPWLYWGSLSDDIIEARVKANDAVGPGAVDMAVGIAAAGAQAWLEKFGATGVVTAATTKKFKEQALRTTLKELAKAGGKAGAGEAVTEAGQTVVEDVAGGLGTKEGVDWEGMPKRIGESALAGGVFGDVAGTTTAALRGRASAEPTTPAGTSEGGSATGGQAGRDAFKRHMRSSESGGDDLATNPESSATGRYQFIDGTWLGLMKDLGVADGSLDDASLLAMRADGDLQERAMDLFIEQNSKILADSGHESTPGNLKLAHILGAAGAAELLSADPNADASTILEDNVIQANKRIFEGKTLGEIKAWADGTVGEAGTDNGRRRLFALQDEVKALEKERAGLSSEWNDALEAGATEQAARLEAKLDELDDRLRPKRRELTDAENAFKAATDNGRRNAGADKDEPEAPATPNLDRILNPDKTTPAAAEAPAAVFDADELTLVEKELADQRAEAERVVQAQDNQSPRAPRAPAKRSILTAAASTKGEAPLANRRALRDIAQGVLRLAADSSQRHRADEQAQLIKDEVAQTEQALALEAARDAENDPAKRAALDEQYREAKAKIKEALTGLAGIQTLNELAATRLQELQAAFNNIATGQGVTPAAVNALSQVLALPSTMDVLNRAAGAEASAPEVKTFLTALEGTDLTALEEAATALEARIQQALGDPSRAADFLGNSVDEAREARAIAETTKREEREAKDPEAAPQVLAPHGSLGDQMLEAARAAGVSLVGGKAKPKPLLRGGKELEARRTRAEQDAYDAATKQVEQGQRSGAAAGATITIADADALAGRLATAQAATRKFPHSKGARELRKAATAVQAEYDAQFRKLAPAGRKRLNSARQRLATIARVQPQVEKARDKAEKISRGKVASEIRAAGQAAREKATAREAQRVAERKAVVEQQTSGAAPTTLRALEVAATAAAERLDRESLARIEAKQAQIAKVRTIWKNLPKTGRPREERRLQLKKLKAERTALREARAAQIAGVKPTVAPEVTEAAAEAEAVRRALGTLTHELRGLISQRDGLIKRLTGLPPAKLSPTAKRLEAELNATRVRILTAQGRIHALEQMGMKAVLGEALNPYDAVQATTRLADPAPQRKPENRRDEVAPEPDPAGLEPVALPAERKQRAPSLVREARTKARTILRGFESEHAGLYEGLVGQAAVVAASRILRGQARVPEMVSIRFRRVDPKTGKLTWMRAKVRGAKLATDGVMSAEQKRALGFLPSDTPYIFDGEKGGWVATNVYQEGGATRESADAREQARDVGAVADLNTLLATHGLLKGEPGMADALLDSEGGDPSLPVGDALLNRKAALIDKALVDLLVQEARNRDKPPAAPIVREKAPHKYVAKPKKAPNAEKPEPATIHPVKPESDAGGRELPARPPEGSGFERRVRVAGQGALPERRPVAALWLNSERAAGRGLNEAQIHERQLEGVDRVVASHEAGHHGFLLADGTGFGKTREMLLSALMIASKTGKPAVILVPNPDTIQVFYKQATAMGIDVTPDGVVAGGKIVVQKYSGEVGQLGLDPTGVSAIFVDEAQAFQNPAARKRRRYVEQLFNKAPFVVYASATPGDKVSHVIGMFAALAGRDPKEFAAAEWGISLYISAKGDLTATAAPTASNTPYTDVARKMFDYIRKQHNEGRALSRQFISEAERVTETIEANADEVAEARAVEAATGRGQTRTNALKLHTQTIKARQVLRLVKKEIKAGRKVVIMASRYMETLNIPGVGERDPMHKLIQQALAAAGITHAVYVGDAGARKNNPAVKNFQDPAQNVDVLITSPSAGGMSIDLDDQYGPEAGGKPRTLIMADLDWSDTVFEQVIGRVERASSITKAKIINLVMSNSLSDLTVDARLVAKRQVLEMAKGYGTEPTEAMALGVRDTLDSDNSATFGQYITPEVARQLHHVDTAVAEAMSGPEGSLPAALLAMAATSEDSEVASMAQTLASRVPEVTIRNFTEEEVAQFPRHAGLYRRSRIGDYTGVRHEILVRRDARDLHGTVLHESAHAVGSVAIDSDPVLRGQLTELLNVVRSHPAAGSIDVALENVHELWTYAMTDPRVRRVLETIPATRRKSVWGKIQEFVLHALRRLGITIPINDSAMDKLFGLRILDRDQASDEQLFLAQLRAQYGGDMTAGMLAPIVRGITTASQNALGNLDPGQRMRRPTLKILTMEQVIEQGKKLFVNTAGRNLLVKVQRTIERTHATIRHLQEKGGDLRVPWVEWSNQNMEASDKLDRLMLQATLYNIDPSDPKAKAPNPAKAPERAAMWPEVHRLWKEIGQAKATVRGQAVTGQDIFRSVRDYYRENLKMGHRTFTANYLQLVFETPPAGVVVPPQYAGKDWHSLIDDPNADAEFTAALDWLETHGSAGATQYQRDTLKTLAEALSPAKREVYFPLRRHGEFVVNYKVEKLFPSDTEAAQYVRDNLGARLLKGDPRTVVLDGFEMFESRAAAQNRVDDLNTEHAGAQIDVELVRDKNILPTEINHHLMKAANARLAQAFPDTGQPGEAKRLADIRATFQNALIDMLPELAAGKASLKRKGAGRPGASLDAKRVFAERVQANSFHMAQLRHSRELFDARQAASFHANNELTGRDRLTAQEYVAELDSRIERDVIHQVMPEWVGTAMNLGYVGFLVGPSFSLVNATQPLLNTWPHLASRVYNGKLVGGMRSAAAMTKAYRAVGGPVMNEMLRTWASAKTLTRIATDASFDPLNFNIFRQIHQHVGKTSGVYASVLQELADRGKIDQSAALDLRGAANTRSQTSTSGLKTKSAARWNYFVEWSRQLPHMVEVLNRSTTAIAAYEVATDSGLTHQAAVDAAANAVTLTQYNYENWNKIPWMKIPALRPFLMFMQFPQHMYYYWFKSAREIFAGASKDERREGRVAIQYMLASHALAGGVIGAMFEPIKWAVGLAASIFGDDDEPWDTEAETRKLMADLAGVEAGEVLSNGLPALLGMNFQGRLGIGDMLFFNPPDLEERGGWESLIYQRATGPLGQVAKNAVTATLGGGLAKAETFGDYSKVFESVLPKFVKDGMKTLRYASDGLVDSKGHTILDARELSPWDLAQQAIGLQPATVSQAWEARNVGYEYRQTITDGRSRLLSRFNKATVADKVRMRTQEIPAWNRKHPYAFARITGETLARSAKSYRTQDRSFYKGVPTKPKERLFMREQLRFSPLD